MLLIDRPTPKDHLLKEHSSFFGSMIKAVVDVRKGIIALDAELHADLENTLLEKGSRQEDVWGINLFLGKKKGDWIEYTALINLRPSMDNRSMEIGDPDTRQRVFEIVNRLIID